MPPRLSDTSAFGSHSDLIEGQWRRVRTVTCCRCGYPAAVTEKAGTPLPDTMLAKKFIQRGWNLSGAPICPRCIAGKRPMAPKARRAAFCAIAGVPRAAPKEPEVVMSAMVAAPPPTSKWEDRRRIREALDMHYDEEAGRYRQSFSDKSLAAKLDVPAKWVTDLREANGYGPDVNESAELRRNDIEAVQAEIASLQTELLERFDALEGRMRKLLEGV